MAVWRSFFSLAQTLRQMSSYYGYHGISILIHLGNIYVLARIYEVHTLSFLTFFLWVFKIVIDPWNFSMLLLYILWYDWPIFRISCSNQQLQQQLEYTLLKPYCLSWWISKMQSGREDTLEEQYAIKLRFKLGKNAAETYEMLQVAFGASWMNWAWVFEWHKRFKKGRESVRDDEMCGRSKEVRTPELIGQRLGLGLLWRHSVRRGQHSSNRISGISTRTIHHVHNSILVTDYWTKMGIKTVRYPPYSPDLAPCDFWLFPKLRGCRYETIEEI